MPRTPSHPAARLLWSAARGLGRSMVLVGLTLTPLAISTGVAVWFFNSTGSVGGAMGVGIGVAGGTALLSGRSMANAARHVVNRWTGTELRAEYREPTPVAQMATGYWWNGYDYQRFRLVALCQRWYASRTRDPAAWRDILWVFLSPPSVGLVSALPLLLLGTGVLALTRPPLIGASEHDAPVVAGLLLVGVLLAPVCWKIVGPVGRRLLGPSLITMLRRRVSSLVQGRADLTRAQDTELHRIERDLHDGTQAKLISVGLSLNAAERMIDADPSEAKALIQQTRENVLDALRSLRELVHGIVPPVLLERGLVDALRALALDSRVPVTVRANLDGRLETPIESALYFAASELLANVAKHAEATSAAIALEREGSRVILTVTDDGKGGAAPRPGSGLAGVEYRIKAFEGRTRVHSPDGGPTQITVEVPCASS